MHEQRECLIVCHQLSQIPSRPLSTNIETFRTRTSPYIVLT